MIPLYVSDGRCIQCLVWTQTFMLHLHVVLYMLTVCLLLTCIRWPKWYCRIL